MDMSIKNTYSYFGLQGSAEFYIYITNKEQKLIETTTEITGI